MHSVNFFKMMCACVCVHVYNCSLAGTPSAIGRIQGPCGSLVSTVGVLLLYRKPLLFMRPIPIKENGQFIQHTLSSVLLYTPVLVLSKGALDPGRQFTPVAEELMSLRKKQE